MSAQQYHTADQKTAVDACENAIATTLYHPAAVPGHVVLILNCWLDWHWQTGSGLGSILRPFWGAAAIPGRGPLRRPRAKHHQRHTASTRWLRRHSFFPYHRHWVRGDSSSRFSWHFSHEHAVLHTAAPHEAVASSPRLACDNRFRHLLAGPLLAQTRCNITKAYMRAFLHLT